MTDTKFTQAPWIAENSSVISINGDIVVGCVVGSVYRNDDAEDYATARLIAAAPDLYSALSMALAHMPDPQCAIWRDVQGRMNAALAKARGE